MKNASGHISVFGPAIATAVARPNKTPPFFQAWGKDGRLVEHVQNLKYERTSIRGLRAAHAGHPRYTWLQTLKADLHPLNHALNSAWSLAQDRELWKQRMGHDRYDDEDSQGRKKPRTISHLIPYPYTEPVANHILTPAPGHVRRTYDWIGWCSILIWIVISAEH